MTMNRDYLRGKKIFVVVWRALTTSMGILGVALLFTTWRSSNVETLFYYFTIQSNILIVALFAVLTVGTFRQLATQDAKAEVYHLQPALHSALVFYMMITFLVFALFLSKGMFSIGGARNLAIGLSHYVVPLLAILDWVFFLPHGKIRFWSAFAWLSYPFAYLLFSLLRAKIGHPFFDHGSRYPYFFIDVDKLGWGNLAWIIPAFTAGFLLLGMGMIFLDKRLAKNL